MDRANLEQAEVKAREMARRLKQELPEGWGFTIVLYNYHEAGYMTYLSTGKREDCIKMLKELAFKMEENIREV